MVHFIMMSTEHDFSPESPQYTWLEKDLKSVDRTKTPWIIIGGHRAMYCSALMPGKGFLFDSSRRKCPLGHGHHLDMDNASWTWELASRNMHITLCQV